MSLNHDAHQNSPKEENYLNGSIDDFTDCIDFTKQYQKSCGYDEIIDDDDEDEDEDEDNGISSSQGECKESVNNESNIDLNTKQDEDHLKETDDKNEGFANASESSVTDSSHAAKNDIGDENHPMEPDVSITVKETNLEKTINHVAKGVDDDKTEEESLDLAKPVESCKIKINKQKLVKKNHLKLPVNKNIKKKISLIKYKNGKFTKKKNESFQYQGIQSNVKFKCYKCSFSDFSSISELQTHQRKCITGTPDFQLMNESASSFTNPSSSNFRITRKVYLCSACGSYYENWNLFLHMKEMHKRHICLYCLGMFSQPDKLAQHLQTKHSVVEQNLSSTEDFLKLYRGTCYLICVSCEAMFSEQEEFYEHSCISSQAEDPCHLCGMQGSHFPNCRRAFSERHVDQSDSHKSHSEMSKKVNGKKKKVKGSKKSKDVFRIISNEQNGEMSVIVKKQNPNDNFEVVGESRSMDSYFSVQKESGDKSEISPSRNSHEDLVSSKQYNEKMLQLYKPNKLPEKVTSSLQSIEDSINRVVENSRISDEDEKGNEEEEEYDTNLGGPDEESSFCDKENSSSLDISSIDHQDKLENGSKVEESSTLNAEEEEQNKSLEVEQEESNRSAVSPDPPEKAENQVASDCESTDSEKLTIAFDQPIEQPSDKNEGGKKEEPTRMPTMADLVCDKSDDNVVTASRDTPYIHVTLKEDCSEVKALIKEFVKVSCWNCVYCSHAKRIAVNGKQLALHILAEHRFVTVLESSSDEEKEESALSIIQRLKNSLTSLENCYFNTDTFDSEDKDFWKANDRIYECFHCLFATYVHKELYSHNRKMHQKAVFLCIMCKSNFYNYSELLCHLCPGIYIAGQVINPDITYRCFLCNVDPLPSSFRLMVHLRRKHNSCDICFDLSSNQFQLSTHVWKHKLSHMCYRCGIAYRNKPDITKHLFWKHGTESVLCKKCLQKKWPHVYHFCVPPNSFICDECSASLKSAVALKVHKRLHSGDYPYHCDKCEEKFISRKLLAKHLIKHEEEANKISKPETPEVEPVQSENQVDEGKNLETEVKSSEDSERKTEKEKKPKKRKVLTDVFDLPPVNLSESDDSDQEDTELKPKVFKPEETSPPVEESQLPNGYLNGDIEKEESSPSQIVDGVWNNFHNYLVAKDMPKTFCPGSPFKNMTLSRIKEIMLSDHDYHIIPNSSSQDPNAPKVEAEKSSENSKKVGLDHDYCNNVPKSKSCKAKQKTKHREDASKSSSSDSSSDSDSSCSCGSNCSCSSGSSSSTSSNDSDSDYREKRKRKESPSEVKVVKEVEPEVPTEVDISVHDAINENLVRDSDLETDETETDEEDFYDYNPAREANRILAEKRTQLLANLNGPDSAVSSPSYKPEKTASPKKKLKFKKRRSQFRLSSASRTNRKKNTAAAGAAAAAAAAIPFSRTPVTPFVADVNSDSNSKMSLDTPTCPPYSRLRTEDSVQSSGEGDSKRPKRKRVPLKFYGFSSDDENESVPTSRKREKGEHSVTSSASVATPPPTVGPSFADTTPHIWNPHSKGSLSWRIEKSESVTPKVNPIKIRTSHSMRQNATVENSVGSELFQIKRPERNFQMNGNTAVATGQKGEKLYCFCQCPYDEVSEMIACDAEDCVIEWFHFECVGIMVPPKGSWYCPDCRKKLAAENEFLSPPVNEQNPN